MSESTATVLVQVVGLYALAGLLFAVAFAWKGAGRIDPNARDGTWGFRLLIVPGAAAFWPLLLKRWLGGQTAPPTERNAHRDAAEDAP